MNKPKLKLESITYIITDDCQSGCVFCVQKRGKEYITKTIIDQSINLFYENLAEEYHISYYGGEPLLGFDQIKYSVERFESLNKKKASYSLTTCGQELNTKILDFFAKYQFELNIGYNAYQAKKDDDYQKYQLSIIENINNNYNIKNSVNMVFGPDNLGQLTKNVIDLIKTNVRDISVTCDIRNIWNSNGFENLKLEYQTLTAYLIQYYIKNQSIPVSNFKERKKGLLKCDGAQDRITVSPDGKLWGCYLFYDLFKITKNKDEYKKYYLGSLDGMELNNRKNYLNLKQYYFATSQKFCFKCKYINECKICPITAALINKKIGVIPEHLCELEKITINARKKFQKSIKSLLK